jgi:hypothetical protein
MGESLEAGEKPSDVELQLQLMKYSVSNKYGLSVKEIPTSRLSVKKFKSFSFIQFQLRRPI